MRSSFLICLLLAACIGLSDEALAETSRERAEGHLKRGIKLLIQNRDREALAEFEAAYELDPTPVALAQMGLTSISLRDWLAGDRFLRRAMAEGATHPWIERNRPQLVEQLEIVARHVGNVTIEGTEGVAILIGNTLAGLLPLSGPVRSPVGDVTITGRLHGRPPIVRKLTIAPGSSVTASFFFPPIEAKPSVVRPARPLPSVTSAPNQASVSRIAPGPLGGWLTLASGMSTIAGAVAVTRVMDESPSVCGGGRACSSPVGIYVGLSAMATGAGAVALGTVVIFDERAREYDGLMRLFTAASAAGGAASVYALVVEYGNHTRTPAYMATAAAVALTSVAAVPALAIASRRRKVPSLAMFPSSSGAGAGVAVMGRF